MNLDGKLFEAARVADLKAIRELLNQGANIHALDEFDQSVLGELVKKEDARECIIYLLDNGYEINSQDNPLDQTSLMIACAYSNKENVKTLLEEKADPFLVDENGNSALSLSISAGCLTCIKLLIDYGVALNEIYHGKTTLMIAIGNKEPKKEIIEFLLENDANINQRTPYGTAIWEAVSYENLEMVKFLVEKGAIVDDSRNIYNENIIDFANRVGNVEIIKYLKSF